METISHGDREGTQGDATSILKPLGLGHGKRKDRPHDSKPRMSHIVLGQWERRALFQRFPTPSSQRRLTFPPPLHSTPLAG